MPRFLRKVRDFVVGVRDALTSDVELTLPNLTPEGWKHAVSRTLPDSFTGKVSVETDHVETKVTLTGLLFVDAGDIILMDAERKNVILCKRDPIGAITLVEMTLGERDPLETADEFDRRLTEIMATLQKSARSTKVSCTPGSEATLRTFHGFVTKVRHSETKLAKEKASKKHGRQKKEKVVGTPLDH